MNRASRVITQIYEIQDPWEGEAVLALGVDRIGSVLLSREEWKNSRIREAVTVSRRADCEHSIIPLFDDTDILFRVVDYYEPDLLHFCDALPGDPGNANLWKGCARRQALIKERYPLLKLMRSIPIFPPESQQDTTILDLAARFTPVSDYLLTDTWSGNAVEAGYIGITGSICNWDTARKLVRTSSVPVVLAGGLSPENVYEAVDAVRPFGVDSCTMTNVRDEKGRVVRFKKDLKRVKSFVDQVRRAERDFLQ